MYHTETLVRLPVPGISIKFYTRIINIEPVQRNKLCMAVACPGNPPVDQGAAAQLCHNTINNTRRSHLCSTPRNCTASEAPLNALRQQVPQQADKPGRNRLGKNRPVVKGGCTKRRQEKNMKARWDVFEVRCM